MFGAVFQHVEARFLDTIKVGEWGRLVILIEMHHTKMHRYATAWL